MRTVRSFDPCSLRRAHVPGRRQDDRNGPFADGAVRLSQCDGATGPGRNRGAASKPSSSASSGARLRARPGSSLRAWCERSSGFTARVSTVSGGGLRFDRRATAGVFEQLAGTSSSRACSACTVCTRSRSRIACSGRSMAVRPYLKSHEGGVEITRRRGRRRDRYACKAAATAARRPPRHVKMAVERADHERVPEIARQSRSPSEAGRAAAPTYGAALGRIEAGWRSQPLTRRGWTVDRPPANRRRPAICWRSARPRPPGERCDYCSAPMGPEHGHLIDIQGRRIMCSCRPCYLSL